MPVLQEKARQEPQISPKFSLESSIRVKTSEDSNDCYITGMVLLSPSKIIIADHKNSSIKMVDLDNNSIADQLSLDTQPYDITLVTSDRAAITLPDKKSVQFISISSNKLSLDETLAVDVRCYGIRYFQDRLLVTYPFPGKQSLKFIDLKGKVFETDIKISNYEMPCYVTSNSCYIYVSDTDGSVLCLNDKGEQTGKNCGMIQPRSLTLFEDDSILVCNYGNGTIQKISSDLTYCSACLTDLKSPFSISWCSESKKLYVSFASNDETYDNVIHIYKKL